MIKLTDENRADYIASCLIEAVEMLKEDEKVNKLIEEHGIKRPADIHKTPFGFSEKEQKWYGWSHRAFHGFGIGDKCKKGELGVGDGYTFSDGHVLKTLDECKQRAIDFAKSID